MMPGMQLANDEMRLGWLVYLEPFLSAVKYRNGSSLSVQADDHRLEPFLYFTADRDSSDSSIY